MDNVRFHKCDNILTAFHEKGHQIEFLPPYSPFLNPIEKLFAKWKNYVKRQNCMNEEQLMQSVDLGFKEITQSDCEGWYRNMKKYVRIFF